MESPKIQEISIKWLFYDAMHTKEAADGRFRRRALEQTGIIS